MILLKSIVQISTCPMPHMAAELCPDCSGIGIVAVRSDPIRVTPVTAFADRKKALAAARSRCSLSITSTKAPSRSIARYRYRQRPRTEYMSRRCTSFGRLCLFVADADPRPVRRELGFPIANRLIAEHEAADQEHLGQIPQTQFVAQPPEHHERDHVARILRPVQQTGAALVQLLRAPSPIPCSSIQALVRHRPLMPR